MSAHRRSPRDPGTFITRRIAVGVLCCATAGAVTLGISLHPRPAVASPATTTVSMDANRAAALTRANRDLVRTAPRPVAKPPAPPKPTRPAPLPRIAGLTTTQVSNAWAVVYEGHQMGISQRGQTIAMATALQESNLVNYRRAVDHDSLGIFQQRPSSGWGTPRQLTNPRYAAHAFYRVLVHYQSHGAA